MPIWEKLVFCSVSSAWADFWRWRHLSDWVQKISCNYCAVPHLHCPSTGKAGTTHPHLHSQPGAGKCYKAFAKWMCLPFGLQSQSSIRKQLQTETGRLGMTPTWTEREGYVIQEWLLLNSCQEMPFSDGSVISATSHSNVRYFLCDYAEFLQYCCLTTLNHFPGLRKQAHIGQM